MGIATASNKRSLLIETVVLLAYVNQTGKTEKKEKHVERPTEPIHRPAEPIHGPLSP
jgi:hypothetical protein